MIAAREIWPDRIRPLKRAEYDRLVDSGLLADARVELLLGSLITRSPQGARHAEVVSRLAERLIRELPAHVLTRVQSPLALTDDSEPEPDIAVVHRDDYTASHPTTAVLVIEVADTTLLKDRGIKAALYATAGVAEYWLVNLNDGLLEVHRHPAAGRYAQAESVTGSSIAAPEAFPTLRISPSELLR
jgi:Uma2 family endonuclease